MGACSSINPRSYSIARKEVWPGFEQTIVQLTAGLEDILRDISCFEHFENRKKLADIDADDINKLVDQVCKYCEHSRNHHESTAKRFPKHYQEIVFDMFSIGAFSRSFNWMNKLAEIIVHFLKTACSSAQPVEKLEGLVLLAKRVCEWIQYFYDVVDEAGLQRKPPGVEWWNTTWWTWHRRDLEELRAQALQRIKSDVNPENVMQKAQDIVVEAVHKLQSLKVAANRAQCSEPILFQLDSRIRQLENLGLPPGEDLYRVHREELMLKVQTAVLKAQNVKELPQHYVQPNESPMMEPLVALLNDPDALLLAGTDKDSPVYHLLQAGLDNMKKFTSNVLATWNNEIMTGAANAKSMQGSSKMYEGCMLRLEGTDKDFQAIKPYLQEKQSQVCSEVSQQCLLEHKDEILLIAEYWKRSADFKVHFESLLRSACTEAGQICNGQLKLLVAAVKGFGRALEKICLRGIRKGLPWDVVRAMIVCHSFAEILEVVKFIFDQPAVKVVELNDRFSSPKEGWADISLYIQIKQDGQYSDGIGELQIVHADMLKLREEFRAHDDYEKARFAGELMRYKANVPTAGEPWSCEKDSMQNGLDKVGDGLSQVLPGSVHSILLD
eukprot:gnl/MRDRNA2_/MRDRNA2_32443_c0_seq1.p1 gnl/MRDRNA2_/MRDRNA2_32443_c0~~gnl/MRDRNA2_/MRDRNA2_32443_c0_seq1.p1  ORF type:complete len:610 (-),score=114.86 gnl/MRDRNA2_/MRDRNA2_32443_c0_seq1:313-2142(-)